MPDPGASPLTTPDRVLILAAGRGRRMREATADRPKCLVTLAGRSLLDWQMNAFRRAGIKAVAAVGGYRADRLAEELDVPFLNAAWETTNMVRSLTCASAWLESGDTLISYSDIAFGGSAVKRLASSHGDIAITYDRLWADLWAGRFGTPLDDAETFRIDDGRVTEIGGRPESMAEVQGQFMGLLRFSVEGWRRIKACLDTLDPETVDRLDMTGLLSRLIAAGEDIRGVPVDGGWVEVDSETDLAYYESMAAREDGSTRWPHDWR